jgi:lactobin A/cerein 7B family class IIb bacteriocin
MKNLEIMGVQEMDTREMKEESGGFILAAFFILECIGLVIAGYFAGEKYL